MRALVHLTLFVLSSISMPGCQPAFAAPSDTCTFPIGKTIWTDVGQDIDPGCVESASALFTVPAAATVRIAGDITFDGSTTGSGIHVLDGGTLYASVTRSTGQITITLPSGMDVTITQGGRTGLLCDGVCSFRGGFRPVGQPGVVPTLDANDPFSIGEVIPCPDPTGHPDCSGGGDRRIVRFAGGDYGWLDPDDVLCFFDPDPGDSYVGADVNFCYEIDAVSPTAVDVNVEQSSESAPIDQAGFPLARRWIAEGSLAAAAGVGERTFVSTADLVPDDITGYHDTKFIRFEDPLTRRARGSAYKIARSLDEVGPGSAEDTFHIFDPRGLRSEQAAGSRFWIDYGWSPGDPFFLMVPVRFESATPDGADSAVVFRGPTSVRQTIFDNVSAVQIGTIDPASYSQTSFAWENVWVRDARGATGDSLRAHEWMSIHVEQNGGTPLVFGRTCITGGHEACTPGWPTGNCEDGDYAIVDDAEVVHIRDWSTRHVGDDWITSRYAYPVFNETLSLTRVHAQFHSSSHDTGDFWGVDPARFGADVSFEDILCDNCADKSVFFGATSGTCVATNWMNWSLHTKMVPSATEVGSENTENCRFRNYSEIGSYHDHGVSGTSLPRYTTNFEIADVRTTMLPEDGYEALSRGTKEIRNGIIWDFLAGSDFSPLLEIGDDTVLENVAVVDAGIIPALALSNGKVARARDDPQAPRVENVTFAWNPGFDFASTRWGVLVQGGCLTDPTCTFSGLLWTGFAGAGSAWQMDDDADPLVQMSAPLCFWNNGSDTDGEVGGFAIPPIQEEAPGFQAAPGAFDPSAGPLHGQSLALGGWAPSPGGVAWNADCGIRGGPYAPGIPTATWAHAISKIAPLTILPEPPRGAGTAAGLALLAVLYRARRKRTRL